MSRPDTVYQQEMRRRKEFFDCPVCGSRLLPIQFEKHCGNSHGINPKQVCVWCREYSWPAKTKRLHVDHLRSCFVRFMNGLSVPAAAAAAVVVDDPASVLEEAAAVVEVQASTSTSTSSTSVEEPTLLSMEHLYPERADVDRLADPSWSTLDFEPTFLNLHLPGLRFQDENLNLAIACVHAYLKSRETTHAWFHVVVRGVALASFLTVLLENRMIRTLPFSCWCDGGLHEARYRQHRHFLVVSPSEERFRRAFVKVRMDERDFISRPISHYPVKKFRAINDAMHFVNTLGYVSHPKSSCRFVVPTDKKLAAVLLKKKSKKNHFHLFKTLPENYRLPLVLQWDGGVSELLYQEKLQNVSATVLAKSVRRIGSRWGMELGLFYGLERGKVLPVEWRFLPTSEPTSELFLHLTSGRKLYFFQRQEQEEMTRQDWLRLQAEGGNLFYDAVAGDVWHPRKRDQEYLNQLKPLMDQVEEMKGEMASLKCRLEGAELEMAAGKREVASLKRRLEEAEMEIVSLKRQSN